MAPKKARNGRSANALTAYNGPIHLPTKDGLDDTPIKVNLSFTSQISASGAGIIAGYVANSDVTVSSDWSSFAATYQEYRVLGIEVKYMNYFNGSYSSSLLQGAGAICSNHVSTIAAPSSLDQVVQVADHKPWRTSTPVVKAWRARGTEELAFTPTSTTATHGGVQYYATVGTPSAFYGIIYITFIVEFRSRK